MLCVERGRGGVMGVWGRGQGRGCMGVVSGVGQRLYFVASGVFKQHSVYPCHTHVTEWK